MFTTLEKIALVCLSVIAFQILRWIYRLLYNNVIGPAFMTVDVKKLGQWAVVTGATDGLGKAYAEALAKKGLNIVLISRSQQKLSDVASLIESKFKVETKIIAVDFTADLEETYSKIEKELYGLEIGVLVNNVGVSYPYPDYFLDLPQKETIYDSIIKCNIYSVTNMTQIVLPQMVERGAGVVINMSSVTAISPGPLLTVYSASKAYIKKFSKDLASEYRKKGIIIQCLMPGYVATKMSKIRRSTWMAPSPEQFVTGALKRIGVQEVTTGYFPHSLMVGIIHFVQGISSNFAVWIIIRTMENIRRRALQRLHIAK